MIPNTNMNCGKCATPMYSDCVLWSGSQTSVACISLTQGAHCCDSTITDVLTDIAQYACDSNVSALSNYTIPSCLSGACECSITDFYDMINAIMAAICNDRDLIGNLEFNWNCYAAPSASVSSVTAVIQYLIDQTCTTGKPSDLNSYCYTLPETYDINTVLEAIMEQTCAFLDMSGLSWGSCFELPISNSLQDVIQNILTTVCTITKLDLSWNCFNNLPFDNTISYSFQNIIDEMSYKLDFQNIVWSCVYDGSSSCTDSISVQFNRLISYMCNQFDVSGIDWSCFAGYAPETYTISGVIQHLVDELCNISLTWGCLTPTTGLANQLQTIIDAINAQTIAYNTDHFTVTGTTCADRGLSLIIPTWTATDFTPAPNVTHDVTQDYYLLDPFGNVRINGNYIDVLDTKTIDAANYMTLGYTGYYLPIVKVPAAIAPTGGTSATPGGGGNAPVGGSVLRGYGFVEIYIQYTTGSTGFTANTRRINSGTYSNVVSVDTISSDTSSESYYIQHKRIVPAQLIKCYDNNWYIAVDKEYLPGGVQLINTTPSGYSTTWPELLQSSSIRVYVGTFTYNLNN